MKVDNEGGVTPPTTNNKTPNMESTPKKEPQPKVAEPTPPARGETEETEAEEEEEEEKNSEGDDTEYATAAPGSNQGEEPSQDQEEQIAESAPVEE